MLTALLLAAAPVTITGKDALLDFTYGWSAEAAAIPLLDRRFRADAATQRRQALAGARADRRARAGISAGWNPHFFSRNWTTAGQSARLLSLEAETGAFTGGAHPNGGTTALLWDRKLGREIALDVLLARPGHWNGAIRQPFCTLLDRERFKRRREPVKRSDMFGDCPALRELTIVPQDQDRDRRFDHLRVTADAYVAGPYAEGEYVISLPVTATMLGRLKPAYRSSFEPQPPVQ